VTSCTNGSMQNLMFTGLSPAQCHDRCAAELALAGQSSGCWILTTGGTCYCRNGTLNTGGTSYGGSCS
jgi:hypothetical protein